jgi:hypothetical protein
MLNDKTVRGTNFTCFNAGLMAGWAQFRLEPPAVPLPGSILKTSTRPPASTLSRWNREISRSSANRKVKQGSS